MKFGIWILYITLNVVCFNTLEKAKEYKDSKSPFISYYLIAKQDLDTITISGSGMFDHYIPRVMMRASSDTWKAEPHPVCWEVKVGSITLNEYYEQASEFIIRFR